MKDNQLLLFEEQDQPKDPEKTEREKELELLYAKVKIW